VNTLIRLSSLRWTNVFFVLFLEQPRLPNTERQEFHFGNPELLHRTIKAACTSFQASTHHVLRSLPTPSPAQERQKARKKTPYSLDIMRLRIAANRRVVNRFPFSMSRIRRTMSRCASLRHAHDLSSVFDGSTDLVKTFNQDHHNFVAESCTLTELRPPRVNVTRGGVAS